MHVLQDAVTNLDNLEDSFADELATIGAKHPAQADFTPDKVGVFVQSVLSVWKSVLMDKVTPECHVAWETLFGYIMFKMKIGHRNRYTRH